LAQDLLMDADQISKSLRNLLKQKGVYCDTGLRKGGLVQQNRGNLEEEFGHILSKLWLGIAKPVLDGLTITVCFYFLLI
jgi:hypothetical protein